MSSITVRGARLHNLKNISLSIPKNEPVVFTGVSGSGKSTMAFDTLHKEGQRQYIESLGLVTYVSKPPVDSISGLSPSISVDQGLSNRSPRSPVGTATEVFTYLRVIFVRVGHRPCPRCGRDVPPSHEGLWDDEADEVPSLWDELPRLEAVDEAAAPEMADAGGVGDQISPPWEAQVVSPHCGARLPEMNMAMFSFNKPAGACLTCTGLGTTFAPDLTRLLDEGKSILDGAVAGWDAVYTIPRHAEHASDAEYLEKIECFLILRTCPDCGGAR